MALRNGSWLDFAIGALFAVSVAVSGGIADIAIYGLDLRDVLAEYGPAMIDVASAISIGAVVWALFLGIPDFADLELEKLGAVVATIGIVALGMIEPGFASESPELGILALGITSAGYWTLYYEGM